MLKGFSKTTACQPTSRVKSVPLTLWGPQRNQELSYGGSFQKHTTSFLGMRPGFDKLHPHKLSGTKTRGAAAWWPEGWPGLQCPGHARRGVLTLKPAEAGHPLRLPSSSWLQVQQTRTTPPSGRLWGLAPGPRLQTS